jgi:hypothetical protein
LLAKPNLTKVTKKRFCGCEREKKIVEKIRGKLPTKKGPYVVSALLSDSEMNQN